MVEAKWVVVPASDVGRIAYAGAGWTVPLAPLSATADVNATSEACPANAASARTTALGDAFMFSFTGSFLSVQC